MKYEKSNSNINKANLIYLPYFLFRMYKRKTKTKIKSILPILRRIPASDVIEKNEF